MTTRHPTSQYSLAPLSVCTEVGVCAPCL